MNLCNYEAGTGYFPVGYNKDLNPYAMGHLITRRLGLDHRPPSIDMRHYEESTGARIDYILIWGRLDNLGAGIDAFDNEKAAAFLADVRQRYDQIYPPTPGMANVFRRKDLGTSVLVK